MINGEGNFWIGIGTVVISVAFFGTTFVPVKRYKCGDGVYVQFMMGIGILFSGFVIFALEGFPRIYPIAMLGGFFWAIANSFAIFLMNVLGMAVAVLVWNMVSCITGWFVARFGIFGIRKAPPKSDLLNCAGLLLLLLSGFVFFFIKSRRVPPKCKVRIVVDAEMIKNKTVNMSREENANAHTSEMTELQKKKRNIALFIAMLCGLLYGNRTTPVTYVQDNCSDYEECSSSALGFAFSHLLGATVTTSVIFVLYAVYKGGRPAIEPQLTVPALTSGVIWSIGMAMFLVSNGHLSQTIAFPVTTVLPSCVAAVWSVLYFREIQGLKDIVIMLCGLTAAFAGAVLIALSKLFAF